VDRDAFLPVRIIDLDIAGDLPTIEATDPRTGHAWGGVFCLVRRNGRPLKVIEFPLHGKDVSPAKLRELIGDVTETPPGPASRRLGHAGSVPFASVIVATRDRAASLAVCLDSLLRQTYPAFDVIVVDNAPSSSETAELVANRYAPTGRVRYLREDRKGLGRAHNSGMEQVTAPFVAFTDDDVIADPRWLESLAANLADSARVGCVTGLILPAELDTRAQYWTERHGGFGKGFERKVYDLAEHRPPGSLFPYTAGQFGSGASMAFRTETLRRVGGFDSALGAGTPARGGDDLAAFFAIVNAGFQLVYEPQSIVWHHHRRNEDGMRRQAFGYGMGLGAYLTKLIVDRPATALHLARVLPAGLAHMMGPSSPKTQRLPEDYPASLVWRERLGILNGVPGYLRSLALLRHQAKNEPRRSGSQLASERHE
jgi:GT2 family glycosyltransferase